MDEVSMTLAPIEDMYVVQEGVFAFVFHASE